jgi:2-phosphosulfolactate phosphatase
LLAKDTADLVLAVSFVNADATVNYIQTLAYPKITIIPMGHEGLTPSLEDNICAQYIEALINGKKVKLTQFLPALKNGPGRYFFSKDQWQYPSEDFTRCLEVGRFNFVIRALIMDNYAILTRVDKIP